MYTGSALEPGTGEPLLDGVLTVRRRQLTGLDPATSTLVFRCMEGTTVKLVQVDEDGDNPRELLTLGAGEAANIRWIGDPTISEDGSRVVFFGNSDHTEKHLSRCALQLQLRHRAAPGFGARRGRREGLLQRPGLLPRRPVARLAREPHASSPEPGLRGLRGQDPPGRKARRSDPHLQQSFDKRPGSELLRRQPTHCLCELDVQHRTNDHHPPRSTRPRTSSRSNPACRPSRRFRPGEPAADPGY